MMATFTLALCFLGQISAERWTHPLTLVPGDNRTYVVLFFSSQGDKEKTVEYVQRLNNLQGRKDVLTIAVTPERQTTADAFIRTLKPRFPVGSRSPSYKTYRIKRFPALLIFRPSRDSRGQGAVEKLDVTLETQEELNRLLSQTPAPAPAPEAGAESLKQYVRSSSDIEMLSVAETLVRLRELLPGKEFTAFCDEIEWQCGFNSRWLGQVRYLRHLADESQPIKQPDPASRAALRTLRGWDPQSSEVQETRRFMEVVDVLPYGDPTPWLELHAEYSSPTDPVHLVCRIRMAQTLGARISDCVDGELGADCLPPLVELLRNLYDGEVDAVVRYTLLVGLNGLEEGHHDQLPGLPGWLKSKLEVEQDIRWVQPVLEELLFEASGAEP